MSRKQISITVGSLLLVLAGTVLGWIWFFDSTSSSPIQGAEQARELHREIFVMDAHTHMINRQLYLGGNIGDRYEGGQVDLPRIQDGGLDAIFFSMYSLEPYYAHGYELKHTLQLMELSLQQIKKNDQIEVALNASDIERINEEGKVAAFLDLEGAYDMDGDPLALQALYRLGLRSLMLPAHNQDSNFADSCCDDHRWGGINERGQELIREMNRLGMIINVAHGSTETIVQAAESSEDPILYSHGGLRHFVDLRRNISDEAAKAIAEKGGVIALHIGNIMNNYSKDYEEEYQRQMNRPRQRQETNGNDSEESEESRQSDQRTPPVSFEKLNQRMADRYPVAAGFPVPEDVRMTVDQLVEVIDYAIQLVGEDHVAIGADFGGAVFPPSGIDDISDYSKITEGLYRKGYSEERIRKIMGGNLLRLIRNVIDE